MFGTAPPLPPFDAGFSPLGDSSDGLAGSSPPPFSVGSPASEGVVQPDNHFDELGRGQFDSNYSSQPSSPVFAEPDLTDSDELLYRFLGGNIADGGGSAPGRVTALPETSWRVEQGAAAPALATSAAVVSAPPDPAEPSGPVGGAGAEAQLVPAGTPQAAPSTARAVFTQFGTDVTDDRVRARLQELRQLWCLAQASAAGAASPVFAQLVPELPYAVGFGRQRQVRNRIPLPPLDALTLRYLDGDYAQYPTTWWHKWFTAQDRALPATGREPKCSLGPWLTIAHRGTGSSRKPSDIAAEAGSADAAGRVSGRFIGIVVETGSTELTTTQNEPPVRDLNVTRYLQLLVGDYFTARPTYAPRQTTIYLAFFADVLGHLDDICEVSSDRRMAWARRRAQPLGPQAVADAAAAAQQAPWPRQTAELNDSHIQAFRQQIHEMREADAALGPALGALRRTLGDSAAVW